MGRPLRIEYPGALYHITSRGNERRDIFLDEKDREKFLETVADYHDRYGILLHCYMLMDNHYHLAMETPLGNLVKVMHGLNSSYTGYFNRKYSRSGHLFQGRYKAILIDKDSYLLELTRYVHLNPVHAGIVESPEKHIWSSYPGYISNSKRVEWVEYSWVLSQFGPATKNPALNYSEFVCREIKGDRQSPLKKIYGQLVLGSKEFIEETKKKINDEKISSEVVERKRLKRYPRPEEILALVAEAFGVPEVSLIEKEGRNNIAKKTAIYLIKRYSGLSNKEVGKIFRGIHYSAVSKAASRLEVELSEDSALADLVNRLTSNVKT